MLLLPPLLLPLPGCLPYLLVVVLSGHVPSSSCRAWGLVVSSGAGVGPAEGKVQLCQGSNNRSALVSHLVPQSAGGLKRTGDKA